MTTTYINEISIKNTNTEDILITKKLIIEKKVSFLNMFSSVGANLHL